MHRIGIGGRRFGDVVAVGDLGQNFAHIVLLLCYCFYSTIFVQLLQYKNTVLTIHFAKIISYNEANKQKGCELR